MFDDRTGKRKLGRDKKEMRRPVGTLPGCYKCAKVDGLSADERTPEHGALADLSKKNSRTLWAYYEARACGDTTTDPVTRRNFATIQWLTDKAGRDLQRAAVMVR